MSDYKKIIIKNSPVAGATPDPNFLDFGEIALNYADSLLYHKNADFDIVPLKPGNASEAAEPKTLVVRDPNGAVYAAGVFTTSETSYGLISKSIESTGSISSSELGTYSHEFRNDTTPVSAIERVRGWYNWFYDSFTGKLKTSNITANREWTLPDRSGTLLLDSSIRSGKVIYVDSTTGTNTRNGLSQYSYTPFATISDAVAASAAGDIVYVRAGTHSISSTINLNGKGHLYFETGTIVNVPTGVTAFTYSQNSVAVYISGYADFITAGTGAILNISGGNSTTAISLECNSIISAFGSGTLFSVAAGTLSINSKLVQATAATVFSLSDSGGITARIPFVYCNRYLSSTGGASSQINSDIWTLQTFNTTSGMAITSIRTANFRIVNYSHAGVGVACAWAQNTQTEGITFTDTRWVSTANLSHMTATTTAASMSTKTIRLRGTNTFTGITNSASSISSTQPINVFIQNSYAATAANSNITFKVGSFTVDADVNNI